jgi:hypothetical protein
MTEGLANIIKELERQKRVIERAVAALRDLEGTPAARKGGMTPAGRRRLSAALKKRWAAKKAAESAPARPQKPASRKVRLTPEGRKRLAEAMKRRWAVKRAALAVKTTGRKERAAKKSA